MQHPTELGACATDRTRWVRSKGMQHPTELALPGADDPDRATHAGAVEAAVAPWILREVLLVVLLCIVKLRRVANLGRDRAEPGAGKSRLIELARRLGGFALCGRGAVDRGTVLCTEIVALAHSLRRVVILPEDLQQRGEARALRVEDHGHHLVMAGE